MYVLLQKSYELINNRVSSSKEEEGTNHNYFWPSCESIRGYRLFYKQQLNQIREEGDRGDVGKRNEELELRLTEWTVLYTNA